jgi:type IV secretory pathway component VirB8
MFNVTVVCLVYNRSTTAVKVKVVFYRNIHSLSILREQSEREFQTILLFISFNVVILIIIIIIIIIILQLKRSTKVTVRVIIF